MELISASLQGPGTQSESNNLASMELISTSLQVLEHKVKLKVTT